MSDLLILSAPGEPGEPYENHVKLCLENWGLLKKRMLPTLTRLFQADEEHLEEAVTMTLLCHDVGKLSEKWQQHIQKPKDKRARWGPPHATLGGPYLLQAAGSRNYDICHAGALAILMHHTDSGLAQGNLEHPAEDAINRGLVEYGTHNIKWAAGAEEVFQSTLASAGIAGKLGGLSESVTLGTLEEMTKNLRRWARCARDLERHRRRLQTLAIHHIVKVCDWRAASQRVRQVEEDEEGDQLDASWKESILAVYLDGGLLP